MRKRVYIESDCSDDIRNDVFKYDYTESLGQNMVKDENDFGSVVDQLKDNDIINYKGLFRLFCLFSGGSDKIAQGTYVLDSDMDYRAIINSLGSNSSSRKEVSVTIP